MTPMRSRPPLASAVTLLLLAACAGAPAPAGDTAPPKATAHATLDSVLADGRLSTDDRAELRELLRIVAARWRTGPTAASA